MTGGYRYQQGSHAAALANGERLLATKPAAAAMQARALLDEDPADRAALALLARALDRQGQSREAMAAREQAMRLTRRLPAIDRAFAALNSGRAGEALKLAEAHLKREPDEPLALLLAGEALVRTGRRREGRARLERAVAAAPGFAQAHYALARLHYESFHPAAALAALTPLGEGPALPPDLQRFRAGLLGEAGDFAASEQAFAALAAALPQEGMAQLDHGHALRTLGKTEAAAAAYARALAAARPAHAAWWGLASLGGQRIDDAALPGIADLAERTPDPELRATLHFALGAALEARGDFAGAFASYAQGNALRRAALGWNADAFAARQQAIVRHCDAAFFAARAGWGNPDPAPIFLVGMARSGSTLLEQALSGHSAIEGCGEMPAIAAVMHEEAEARGLDVEADAATFLQSLSAADCARLGGEYLNRVAVRRRQGKARFIDKLPHNWAELAFIRLILPKAAIIDLRRHPRDCALSNFALLFAPGHPSSYGLGDWAAYYAAYRAFLRDCPVAVIPARYEALVDDMEGELRRILSALDLPWDAACLDFAGNARAVATASAEQVRRPLNRAGIGAWKRFEPWLGDALPRLEALVDAD